MRAFSYERVKTPAEAAAAIVRKPNAKFIAGGTNLLDLMKVGIETPRALIDLKTVHSRQIDSTADGALHLGAGATNTQVAADRTVRERYPVLARAILSGASAQIRNRATVAGNLLQRTRCAYFYNLDLPCNKRQPGSGCSARDGVNRMHAIFGASTHCVATHPSDMAVALAALDAQVELQRADQTRHRLPLAEFHTLPGDTPQRESVLQPGELISAVHLPAAPQTIQIYRKVRDRASFAFGLVSVAAVLTVAGGKVSQARLAFGGVAAKPWRQPEAEQALLGTRLAATDVEACAAAAVRGAAPLHHNAFKPLLLQQTLRQVLSQAATQVQERS